MNITLSVSGKLEQLVRGHPEVKWTSIARGAMEEKASQVVKLEILRKYVDNEKFTKEEISWMDENDWHPVDEKQIKQQFIAEVQQSRSEKAKKVKNVSELFH